MIRKLGLSALKATAFDFSIRHHWVPEHRLKLNSYMHRSYWGRGKRREHDEMELIAKLISPGDTVIEVGAHIGYLSQYFVSLVGPEGAVHVFEPTPDTLRYLKKNLEGISTVRLIECAVSDQIGTAEFFTESLTGQNNSLINNHRFFVANKSESEHNTDMSSIVVETVTLDSYVSKEEIKPNFIKIDIEEAEIFAIRGMLDALDMHRPICMIEVVANKREIHDIFRSRNYEVFDSRMKEAPSDTPNGENQFFIPVELLDTVRNRL